MAMFKTMSTNISQVALSDLITDDINSFMKLCTKRKRERLHIMKRNAQIDKSGLEQILKINDDEYVYHHVTGLHGDQRDPKTGELRGNLNGDFFRWQKTLLAKRREGIRTFATWVGADVLENHDVNSLKGYIPDVYPVLNDKSIEMLHATSRTLDPLLCQRLEKEQVTDTSMGALVEYSYCSIPGCHRHASNNNPNITEDDWCEHLRHLKGQRDPETGRWVYEDNRGVFGIENSWITVGVGADPLAKNRMRVAQLEEITYKQQDSPVHNISIVDLFNLRK